MQLMKLFSGCLIVILAGVAHADSDSKSYPLGQRSLFSDRTIAERVKPSAQVCVEGDACAAQAPVMVAAAGGASAAALSPEARYNQSCKLCHGAGLAGAPKVGKAADWKPRIAKGMDTLVKHAIVGFNAMPAKGTCATCSDAEIRATVKYMVDHSK